MPKPTPDAVRLRAATAEDAGFLVAMLYEAFDWAGELKLGHAEMLARPEIAHYVEGWPRPGDFGVVAEAGPAAEVSEGERLGAVWARTLPTEDPGYGFVAADVPELTLAVAPAHRGRGLGGLLLAALVTEAGRRGITRLSLSVEDGNAAVALYRRAGFRRAGREGNSDTLLLEL